MTTRKIDANRRNAAASTGPKTSAGRRRAARNALQHGLSVPVSSDAALCEDIESLARDIAGPDANAEVLDSGRRVAEAQLDLRRIRRARHEILTALGERHYESPADIRRKLALIAARFRRDGPNMPRPVVEKNLDATPPLPEKIGMILTREAKRLFALDRYERRALSRRNSAIRALDAVAPGRAPR